MSFYKSAARLRFESEWSAITEINDDLIWKKVHLDRDGLWWRILWESVNWSDTNLEFISWKITWIINTIFKKVIIVYMNNWITADFNPRDVRIKKWQFS